jgi:excisionase family DNA binding protein
MPTFRMKEAASLLGVSDDTLRRWTDGGRIKTITDASGVLAVDGVEVARLAQELAESADHAEGQMVVAQSVRNRFTGLVSQPGGPAVAHRPGPRLNRVQDQRYVSGVGISSTGR